MTLRPRLWSSVNTEGELEYGMEFKDYYQILGVDRKASLDEIKKAYRRLARKYHPDVSKESDAEARFKEIGEAYEVLKDPDKRAAYDQLGNQWQAGQEFRPPPNWNAGFEFRGDFNDPGGFSDFFESLFGGGRGAGGGRRGRRARVAGEDHHARIEISLEDAYHGTTRTITLQAPELSPDGHVATRQHSLNVKIPRGVTAGQRIRLSGQGSASAWGGSRGDLYLEIMFRPHPLYRAEGRAIYLDLPVAPWEAALGQRVPVPTLGGRVELKIPPGSQTGDKLRLKGRGLPGNPPGDQYVVLKLVTPRADTPAARALYEKMAADLPFNPRAGLGL